jgi:hypothetical protein
MFHRWTMHRGRPYDEANYRRDMRRPRSESGGAIECVCDLSVVVADGLDGAGGIPLRNGVHDVHPRPVPDS